MMYITIQYISFIKIIYHKDLPFIVRNHIEKIKIYKLSLNLHRFTQMISPVFIQVSQVLLHFQRTMDFLIDDVH